jgi:cation diffusion facilitator family transporter
MAVAAQPAPRTQPEDLTKKAQQMRFAMRLSLIFGALMLIGKVTAYVVTGSTAILSDAAESVVHVIAVGFATFALWLSARPANQRFLYGYERITFFSAGFEGGIIIVAAIAILYAAIHRWLTGLRLEHLGMGSLVVLAAAFVNLALGWYLIRTGKRNHSLILEADGKHVLTDSWTSFGVVLGLGLVMLTGWKPFDPICAMVIGLNILYSGGLLVARSARGLLDYSDPGVGRDLGQKLDALCSELGLHYHGVRFRTTGYRLMVELHLLFPYDCPVGQAHHLATQLEERLPGVLGVPAEVVTHLESLEDHSNVHRDEHYTGKPS